MAGMIMTVILTLVLVGGATGAVMYRVLDRGGSSAATNDGAVVEPIYSSPSPSPDEGSEEQTRRPTGQQPTQKPTTIVIVPGHTASPTPFHEETEEPHSTAEQDEGFEEEEPTPDEFEESPE